MIIHPYRVLTAAHCISKNTKTSELFKKEDIIVSVGVYNRTLVNETTRQVLSVKKIYQPAYHIGIYNDLTVLEFNEEIQFNENVRPICLPRMLDTVPDIGMFKMDEWCLRMYQLMDGWLNGLIVSNPLFIVCILKIILNISFSFSIVHH